jgi:mRNA-degrading endonuclease RelE of RelBE toxin-antitoxin system
LDSLIPQVARRIIRFLFERVAQLEDPRSIGDALKGSELGELWKYRVGDYRIIASIEDKTRLASLSSASATGAKSTGETISSDSLSCRHTVSRRELP